MGLALEGKIASPGSALPSKYRTVKTVRKTADEIVNNSATLQGDDELVLAVGASEVWYAVFYVRAKSATTTPDMTVSFSKPTGATIQWGNISDNTMYYVDTDSKNEDLLAGITVFRFDVLIVNSTTAGNLQFQWCQKTATAEDTTVEANSCIIATQLV